MDVLTSLNIEELPEQQTRMMHLLNEYPDFKFRLGFDACCTCGMNIEGASSIVLCPGCKRVKYCSKECQEKDSTPDLHNSAPVDEGEESENAQGHTPIICALLQTCDDDEDVEEGTDSDLSKSRRQAAIDRIRSEYESYPASLANIIVDGPCFQEVLKECNKTKNLVIHILGASEDAELAPSSTNGSDKQRRYQDYSDALSNLTERYKGIQKIELLFIGPECPENDIEYSTLIPGSESNQRTSNLHIRTIKAIYSKELLDECNINPPNVVVFFNPGFTVPEYENWNSTLASIPKGTPFLSTTNTEMEGVADCQYLLDQDRIETIPPALADVFGVYSTPDDDNVDDDEDEIVKSIFSENPFCGSRVRQSETMGNDVYVKNRWMLLGILDSFDSNRKKKDSVAKKMKTGGSTNSKSNNPALI